MKSVKSELPFMSYIKTVNKTCSHPHRSCFPKTQLKGAIKPSPEKKK